MDLHEAQQAGGGGGPVGSPHEINNLKQQLQDTKKKLEVAEKQVEEKSKLCTELENKMKVIKEQSVSKDVFKTLEISVCNDFYLYF